MEICTRGIGEKVGAGRVHGPARLLASQPALLQWIAPHELDFFYVEMVVEAATPAMAHARRREVRVY